MAPGVPAAVEHHLAAVEDVVGGPLVRGEAIVDEDRNSLLSWGAAWWVAHDLIVGGKAHCSFVMQLVLAWEHGPMISLLILWSMTSWEHGLMGLNKW